MSRGDIQHRQQRLPLLVMDFSASVFKRQQRQLLCCRSNLCVVCLKRRSACKAVLSEAFVTRDKVPGLGGWGELSVRQYLAVCVVWYEVLPYRQLFSFDIPRASPSVTTALPPYGQWVQGQISLSIAFQAIPPHVFYYGCPYCLCCRLKHYEALVRIDKNRNPPLEEYGGAALVPDFRFCLIRASS